MKSNKIVEIKNLIEEHYNNITGIIVKKNDQILFEEYFNKYTQDDLVHVASVTKSIVSALVGIAINKQAIKSVDQKIIEFFPDYKIKRGERNIQKIRIKHLLTMTAPYKFKHEPYTKVYSSKNWTKAALDLLGGKGQIGEFKYTSAGLQVLSGILVNATGKSMREFANENLFNPLEFNVPHNREIQSREEYLAFIKNRGVSGWVADALGVNTAGWGLALKTADMAKIGQLYLNEGRWKDKEILASDWIKESTRMHS